MSTVQSTGDMPSITSSMYGSSTTAWEQGSGSTGGIICASITPVWGGGKLLARAKKLANLEEESLADYLTDTNPMPNDTNRRIVQVFIADPNPNVPLDRALLYSGAIKFTDSTDQELYFELPIADLLAKHNLERVKWADKEASKRAGKDVLLEPARVRDLRMVVVNVASF